MKKPDQQTIVVGDKTAAALFAKFAESCREETPPPGTMSAREISDAYGLPFEATRISLMRLAAQKKCTATPVRRFVNGKLRVVMYYTPPKL